MFFYLLLMFTLIPFVELALLLEIHSHIGLLPTLALVFGTGILGAFLARWQGVRTAFRIQQEMSQGRMPSDALVDGALILVAGAVLLTPGIMTDLFGFALLLPPLRNLFKRVASDWFKHRIKVHTVDFSSQRRPTTGDRIIDVEVQGTRTVSEEPE